MCLSGKVEFIQRYLKRQENERISMTYEEQIIEQLQGLGAHDEAAQDFLNETIRCLQGKAYRATTILAWTTLMFFLYKKIVENGIGPFIKLAKEKGISVPKSVNTFYDLNKFDDRRVIELAHAMGIFDRNALKILIYCLDERNSYAHVGQSAPDEVNTLAYLQKIIQHIEIIRQSRFEYGTSSLLQAMKAMSDEERRVKISQLGIEQIKSISLQILNDLCYASDTTSWDELSEHISILEEIAQHRVSTTELLSLLEPVLACYHSRSLSWRVLVYLLKPLQVFLGEMAINRYFVENGGVELLLRLLEESQSWHTSNDIGVVLMKFIQHFTERHIITLTKLCEKNDQICYAWRIRDLRRALVRHFSGKLPDDLLNALDTDQDRWNEKQRKEDN